MDGLKIARERIAQEAKDPTGTLDISGLGLKDIPKELFKLTHLVALDLGYSSRTAQLNSIKSLSGLEKLTNLTSINCSYISIDTLKPLKKLTQLTTVDCSHTSIDTLKPLEKLTQLTTVSCSYTSINTLKPLEKLAKLTSIDCSGTSIDTLKPLEKPTQLTTVDCSDTKINTLKPLEKLTKLTTVDCSHTKINTLKPLEKLTQLTTVDCSNTLIDTLKPLEKLIQLTTVDFSDTSIDTLKPIEKLTRLTTVYCSNTLIDTLKPLEKLTQLTTVYCSHTKIDTLKPIEKLTKLTSVYCSHTKTDTLKPLEKLADLTTVYCSHTKIDTLKPLEKRTRLTTVDCSHTKTDTLKPLEKLANLTSVDCSHTKINTLKPLEKLENLTSVDCSHTKIDTLKPLEKLANLTSVDCSHTKIDTLKPLEKLTKLTTVDCSDTKIDSLSPCDQLPNLRSLQANHLCLTNGNLDIFLKLSVRRLYMFGTTLNDAPEEVLSESMYSNCITQLQAHIKDLGENPKPLNHVKTLILGNGRAGKTQLFRNLAGLPFENKSLSTHGIDFHKLRLRNDQNSQTFKFWDFGGQDIYHGTHALFVKGRGIFIIVWNKTSELLESHKHNGQYFNNERLPYWVKFIEHLSGRKNPLIIVQSHCDDPNEDVLFPPIDKDILSNFPSVKTANFGAQAGRGRDVVERYLVEAASTLPQILIGPGRLSVKDTLEKMKTTCTESASTERFLSFDAFKALCEAAGDISDVEVFAQYLHDCDIIFFRKGVFDDRIILDPAWAFEAIYAIFNRDESYAPLKAIKGRFTRALLGALMWDKNHSIKEQTLFIEMMLSCGMCFSLSPPYAYHIEDREYIAPDLLPDGIPKDRLVGRWDENESISTLDIELPLMSPSVLRTIMSDMGAEAGSSGVYWKSGFYLYETQFKSHAIIEAFHAENFSGKIRIRTQGGQCERVQGRLHKRIFQTIQRMGLTTSTPYEDKNSQDRISEVPLKRDITKAPMLAGQQHGEGTEDTEFDKTTLDTLKFGYETVKGSVLEAYVSYAWNDDKTLAGKESEEKEREEKVDKLMSRAETKGILIKRDKDVLSTGDNLKKFMTQLSRGDRIFVFLSDKYLHSTACMYELYNIWKWSLDDEEKFLDAVRVFKLDANIFDIAGRLQYVDHWKQKVETVEPLIVKNIKSIAPETLEEFQLMQSFHLEVDKILSVLANTVLERDFDKFVKEGFEGLMGSKAS